MVAGGDLQEEVVESEGTVLENRLTYKKRCVSVIVCGLHGRGEGGKWSPGGSPVVCWRGEDRRGMERGTAAVVGDFAKMSAPISGLEDNVMKLRGQGL